MASDFKTKIHTISWQNLTISSCRRKTRNKLPMIKSIMMTLKRTLSQIKRRVARTLTLTFTAHFKKVRWWVVCIASSKKTVFILHYLTKKTIDISYMKKAKSMLGILSCPQIAKVMTSTALYFTAWSTTSYQFLVTWSNQEVLRKMSKSSLQWRTMPISLMNKSALVPLWMITLGGLQINHTHLPSLIWIRVLT